jgi:hypothetical protein
MKLAILTLAASSAVYQASLDEAQAICKEQGFPLPSLGSIRDGTLLSILGNQESTWVDAVIQRGPWTWHTPSETSILKFKTNPFSIISLLVPSLHHNQGCYLKDEAFVKLFQHPDLENQDTPQKDCVKNCANEGFVFAGLSMVFHLQNETLSDISIDCHVL